MQERECEKERASERIEKTLDCARREREMRRKCVRDKGRARARETEGAWQRRNLNFGTKLHFLTKVDFEIINIRDNDEKAFRL